MSKLWLLVLISALAVLIVALYGDWHAGIPHEGGGAPAGVGGGPGVEWAKLVILVDNNPDPKHVFRDAWGLSILVVTPNGSVLFDSGPDPEILAYNARAAGVDLCSVKAIVVSHEHLDHVGGLRLLAEKCSSVRIYIPSGSSTEAYLRSLGFKNIVSVNRLIEVIPGVYVVKPLYGPPWEQALALRIKGFGVVVLVGCSHPGVVNLAKEALESLGGPAGMVIGGFHMFTAPYKDCLRVVEELVALGFKKIVPIHCSGDTIRSILAARYPERFIEGHVGMVLFVSGKGVAIVRG